MWSYFSRDPAKNFPYDIGNIIPGLEDKSLWKLHEGKHKATGDEVSIFVFDIAACSENQAQIGKASFKRIKTLRHPNFVTYLDGLEAEKVLYVVTEKLIPLETFLKDNESNGIAQNNNAISWGLHQIVKGLSFLVNDAKLVHNNVCIASVFVDSSGEWKLGGVDYVYPVCGADSIAPVKTLASLEKYDPPEKISKKPTEPWSSDMWGLGCLIWEIYNGTLPKTNSLKSVSKIPKNLVSNYCELVGANPKARPNPAQFISDCKKSNGFMNNKFVETMLFLEEIQIKEQSEKTEFFASLSDALDDFPNNMKRNKILPQLLHAFEFGNAGSAVLTPLFKIGKMLESSEYQQKIVPVVIKLFSSTDRATRVKLLQQLEHFVEHLTPDVVNLQIYPNIMQGFRDTNPVVREHTIKSILHLAPKLNYKNLNEELLKMFAQLQARDDQGGIRTNTIVCLGKIAGYLNPSTRMRILSSAYVRALKDPFPPARNGAIMAMMATHNYFTLAESTSKLLPSLCQLTLDPEKQVRDQSFKAIKCFLGKLEKVSENQELLSEIEKDVLSSTGPTNAGGWTGWAVTGMSSISSLTSKIVRSGVKQDKPINASNEKPKTSDQPISKVETESKTAETTIPAPNDLAVDDDDEFHDTTDVQDNDNHWKNTDDQGDENGWSDGEWGNMEDLEITNNESSGFDDWSNWNNDLTSSNKEPKDKVIAAAIETEYSPWGNADFVETKHTSSISSYNWGDTTTKSDFFDSVSDSKSSNAKKSSSLSNNLNKINETSHNSWDSSSWNTDSQSNKTNSNFESGKRSEKSSWGNDDWNQNQGNDWNDSSNDWTDSPSSSSQVSSAEIARKQREEKRLARQKEIEMKRSQRQTGAMKLGTKKISNE